MPERHGPIPIAVDQRVRVALSSRVAVGDLQGTVISISPDMLAVEREEGGIRRLSRSQVAGIEVSVGRERDPIRAARYGILAGAPLLVLAVLFAPIAAGESGNSAVGLVLVPVAAVAAVGAAIGSGAQDVWIDGTWAEGDTVDALGSLPADSLAAENP